MLPFVVFAILFIIIGSFAWGALSAAPFVPLKHRDIKRLLTLADCQPGELIVDLGCGDGRLVIAAAENYKLRAFGFEVAVVPLLLCVIKRSFSKERSRIKFYWKNFWQADLSEADIVFCFLTPPVMVKLEDKLRNGLKPGARFVSYAFPLPNIVPTSVSKPLSSDINIYLYKDIVRPVGKVVDI